MAGLLGDGWDSPQSQGLLALAAGMIKGDFGGGVNAMSQTIAGSQDRDLKRKHAQMLMDADQRKVKQEEAQAMEAERIRALIRGAGRPMGATNQVNSALPPDLQIGAQSAIAPQIDYQELIRQGVPFEQVKALAESRNFGRDKVARTAEIEGPNGSKLVQGFDDYGQRVGQGEQGYVDPVQINQGNKITIAKPMSGASFPIGMSPSEQDASGARWAAHELAKQRLDFEMNGSGEGGPSQAGFIKQFGKPQAGYRWKPDGSMEAIPGGPADIKAGINGAKDAARAEAGRAQAGVVLDTVKEAKDLVGMSTAGYGSWLSAMPSTDARNLAAKLTTIKANLGFDRLQQMREQSPTGGALGQVAVQELVALQATVASLDQGQTPKQLQAALDKIEKHYNNWQKTLSGGGGAEGSWDNKPKPAGQAFDTKPPAHQYKGKRMTGPDGKRYQSDGLIWKEVQ